MWPDFQETADLATFTEDIFNGILHFLCSATQNGAFCEKSLIVNYFRKI